MNAHSRVGGPGRGGARVLGKGGLAADGIEDAVVKVIHVGVIVGADAEVEAGAAALLRAPHHGVKEAAGASSRTRRAAAAHG